MGGAVRRMVGPLLRKPWRWLGGFALAFFALLVAGELIARFGLGLGTPPLSVAHPSIEYMFKPEQKVNRFGHRVEINAYGMRSDAFPAQKGRADELRVMVYGDSVINGGNLTDQADVCTEILKGNLERGLGVPVVVGNVSAGSWGPPNLLAYYNTYGALEADLAVIVVSDHDWEDVPAFGALNPRTHPVKQPLSALSEGVVRYFWPRLKRRLGGSAVADASFVEIERDAGRSVEAVASLGKLVADLEGAGVPTLVLMHWERQDLLDGIRGLGIEALGAVAGRAGADVVELEEGFRKAMDQGVEPYRDKVHLNAAGQELLAESMRSWILERFVEADF